MTSPSVRNEITQVWNFRGRYAEYMRTLQGQNSPQHKIFDQIYHGYVFCCLYGLLKGTSRVYDPKTDNLNDVPNQGFRWAYAEGSGIYGYDNLRKLVLLFSKSSNTPFTSKMDNTLRFDYPTNDLDPALAEKSQYGNNSDIIDGYVLGGLELIYNKVIRSSSYEETIEIMEEIVDEMKDVISRLPDPNDTKE